MQHRVDEFTREALTVHAAHSIDADDVVATIERLVAQRGAPAHLRMDSGPELVSAALRRVLDALNSTIEPSTFDRIGVRYVDRVQLDETTDDLAGLVRPEVLGTSTVEPGEGADLVHSLSDTEFRLHDASLRGRWGCLPASAQLDPLHGDPLDTPCWILDLDMYSGVMGEFNVERLTSTAEQYAERIYRFFRWAVRPEFLQRYGGAV